MKSFTSVISAVALVLPLAVAECDNFAFAGNSSNEGYTAPYESTFRTSAWVNCTAELAGQNLAMRNACVVHNPSSVGIVAHPLINLTNLDTEAQRDILSLVRDNISASAAASTNFNTTVVMNFTSQATFYPPVGQAGYSAFTPYVRCWDGVLSDCDDDDGLEGKAARVCGLAWFHADDGAKPRGQQMYDGIEGLVQTDLSGGPADPPASYESVANQATDDEGDDDHNSAAAGRVDGAVLLFALLCSVYGIVL
ncbi:hypothetical protein F5Y05DRAFT_193441 [Hypoxylon sp. FL0543]|nr:hypothetical protein F5Y05DRAFT_193441 [Hypoxylon sp. FL0543]